MEKIRENYSGSQEEFESIICLLNMLHDRGILYSDSISCIRNEITSYYKGEQVCKVKTLQNCGIGFIKFSINDKHLVSEIEIPNIEDFKRSISGDCSSEYHEALITMMKWKIESFNRLRLKK